MMSEASQKAEQAVIEQHLRHLTRRWGELDRPCVFEIRLLTCDDAAAVKNVTRYRADAIGIEMAAEHAAAMNAHRLNAYVVVNPIDAEAKIETNKGAKDEHIVASFFHWADGDDQQAADNIKSFVGPKPTWHVLTGSQPCFRPHVYWELEDPTYNLDAWNRTQKAIAANLRTDNTVVNPSRIMRLAGTVNWPKPKKLAKGYVAELTTLHIHSEDDRPRVTSERMARAFAVATPVPASGLQIATNVYDGPTSETYADMLRRARTDGEKHGGVRDLAASLAGQGIKRELAEAIVRDACPVWDEGVERLLDTAYEKFAPVDAPAVQQMAQEAEAASDWPTPLLEFDEAAIPKRQWVYGTDYIRKYVSVVASAGGVGKTSQAVVEAMAIVTGKPLLGVKVKEPCNAWIVNLEDPREELLMRALAARKHYGIAPDAIKGKLFLDGEDTIQITLAAETRDGVLKNDALLDAIAAKIIENNIGVVIFDPFVSTHIVNENSNASIQSVVAMFRDLARRTEASISLVHHVRKGNGEDATVDSVRGAGSLIGAARAARVVNRLSEKQAESLGLKPKEARSIFRVDDGKANLAPPAEDAVYRQMTGVQIGNGEWVGVCTLYELPDEWAGMSESVVNDMLRMIRSGPARDDDSEEYYSARPQDKARWVGNVITDYAFEKAEDLKSTAQAKTIIKQWLEAGLLEEVEYYSAAQRKDRKGVTAVGRVGAQE